MRDGDQADTRITVDFALQKHDQLVVQPTVNEPRPGSERHATKEQLSAGLLVERVKYDLNHDQIGIQAIGSRSVNEIWAKPDQSDLSRQRRQ